MSEFERVDLPAGQHAILRDPETVTERLRRPVRRVQMRIGFDSDLQAMIRWQGRVGREFAEAKEKARANEVEFDAVEFAPSEDAPVKQATLTDEQLDLLTDLTDAVTVALIESWSYPEPVSVAALQDLPQNAYEALLEAAGKHRDKLLPSFDVDPDADSPTEPSDESETLSKA